MTRQELFIWIRQQYGTEPEYPWHDWNAVLRHNDNNKWYGVVLEVSADKLGLPEAGIVDVLNVKSDPLLIGSLRGQDGYFPAYHMNKEKWLSIQLAMEQRQNEDQRTLGELFFFLIDEMADITFRRSLCILMDALMASLQEILKLSDKQLTAFTVDFEARLPEYLRNALHPEVAIA